jgi:hypothetical protein
MKVFDCDIEGSRKGGQSTSGERVLGKLASLRRKKGPKDVFIEALKGTLDNRFVMLCEVSLEGIEGTLPLILIGPTGIWVILPSEAKGVYRASEEVWEELDPRTRGYKPAKNNPMSTATAKASALTDYLNNQGVEPPPIEPVVFFVNPGAHVDTSHPATRIVLIDGLQRFITSVLRNPMTLDGDAIQMISNSLLGEEDLDHPVTANELRDAYSLRELPPPKKPAEPSRLAEISRAEPVIVRRLSKYLPFSGKQWILLGLLLLVNFIILVGVVIIVLIIT